MDRYQKQLFNHKASMITTGIGEPSNAEGSSGAITIRDINGQITLFAKYGSTWHGRDLGPTLIIGDTHLNHVTVGTEGVNIKDGSTSLASFGETTIVKDINLTGKINITSTATQNVVIGVNGNDAGDDNVVIGFDAGAAIDADGDQNVIIGSGAGNQVESGTANVLIGHKAGENIVDSGINIAIGRLALQDAGKTAPTLSTGDSANQHNTAVGFASLSDVDATGSSEGFGNCGFGSNAGDAITTGNYNICLGYGADVAAVDSVGAIVIGTNRGGVMTGVADKFTFGKHDGKAVSSTFSGSGTCSFAFTSDERKKTNIQDDTLGLEFINKLKTRTFKWKSPEECPEEWHLWEDLKDSDENLTGEKRYFEVDTSSTMHGFIAQEVKAVLDEYGVTDSMDVWSEDEDGMQRMSEQKFIIPLTKAVQELSVKLDTMQTEIDILKG